MIDEHIVAHVARLARLELSEEERRAFREQLGTILEHFQSVRSLDLRDVPPTFHAVPLANVLRDDVPRAPLPQEEVLAGAPDVEDGYFVVPPVIEPE
jgi:aspartyl-tRNA(Asn)/glutamyl-tRNA(Gln) amidotransferase subunit C